MVLCEIFHLVSSYHCPHYFKERSRYLRNVHEKVGIWGRKISTQIFLEPWTQKTFWISSQWIQIIKEKVKRITVMPWVVISLEIPNFQIKYSRYIVKISNVLRIAWKDPKFWKRVLDGFNIEKILLQPAFLSSPVFGSHKISDEKHKP